MANKRKKQLSKQQKAIQNVQVEYMTELETNPEFDLQVDSKNKYSFSQQQKLFIEYYMDYRNVKMAAELTGIDMDTAKEWFKNYNVQKEIRRINKALYQRQFAKKLLSLDDIGGYLSSLITDENVPLGQQLDIKDKLKVIDTLLEVIKLKSESFDNPAVIIDKDINTQIKDLSVDTIRTLLNTAEDNKEKKELIEKLNQDKNYSIEEKAYLETLSTSELLDMIEKMKKGDK